MSEIDKLKLTSTRDSARNHGIKILIYGYAGVGKTRLCGTLPYEDHEILILSSEAGLLSLRDRDIPAMTINSLEEIRTAYGVISSGDHPFKAVCLDSISDIAEVILTREKENSTDARQAYGEMAEVVFKTMRAWRDLPNIDVVFIAKQDQMLDSATKAQINGPSFPGKLTQKNIAYYFDEVFALRASRGEDGNVIRRLQTVNDGVFVAKDRSGALAQMERADLATVLAKIRSDMEDHHDTPGKGEES